MIPDLLHITSSGHDLLTVEQGLHSLCRQYGISRVRVFGSTIHGDRRADSDLDLIVEFEPGRTPGFTFARIADELTSLLGVQVDLHTAGSLSKFFRDNVLQESEVVYAAEE